MVNDPQNPEVLIAVGTESEASAIANALAERGLAAQVVGGVISGFKAEAPATVNVLVARRDLDRARMALAAIRKEDAAINWSELDVGDEPAEDDIPESRPVPVRALVAGGFFGLVAGVMCTELGRSIGYERVIWLAGLIGGFLGALVAVNLQPPDQRNT